MIALGGFFAAGLTVVAAGAPGPILPAILWSFAALACGFVVGFLFAVPRAGEQTGNSLLKINNNLVEVSDWLTKIIVGLGLIHLSRMPGYLQRAGYYVGQGLRKPTDALPEQFAAGILLYFAVLGFLAGYLITRLAWGPAFRNADEAVVGSVEELISAPVESTPGTRETLAPDLRATANQLAAMPLSEVANDADQLTAWARAQFESERYRTSLDGFRRAIELKPESPRIRYLYALALKYASAPQTDVVAQLGVAKRLVESGKEPEMRDRVYISYTFNALYLPKPEGYTAARDAAEEYLKQESRPRPEILVNLTCAYGQQFSHIDGDAQKREAREKALAAMKRTLSLDPGWRPRFVELFEGKDGDTDLVQFRDDEDFKAALGLY